MAGLGRERIDPDLDSDFAFELETRRKTRQEISPPDSLIPREQVRHSGRGKDFVQTPWAVESICVRLHP